MLSARTNTLIVLTSMSGKSLHGVIEANPVPSYTV